jgi:CheY-like chemotaxis protein
VVKDTGCGMSPETLAHVFEPFYTTKDPGKGTGLGLATVHGVVEQSGGHVSVQSELGAGATFRVYLPRTDESPSLHEAVIPPSPLLHGAETVLLVEDEDSVRAVAREVLRAHGYRVLEATNGVEALRVAEEHDGPLHLLVSDVIMPEMGGGELAHRLLKERPGLRVLFFSGYTDDAIIRSGVHDRVTAFLHKPFSIETLARKVRDVLDAPDRLSAPTEQDVAD